MVSGSFSIQVLIQVCLLKLEWESSKTLSCQTVCSIEFLWDHGQATDKQLCQLQVYATKAVCKYLAFVANINHTLQIVELTESAILLRNFNPHIGTDSETWKGMISKHENPAFNKNYQY